MTRHLKARLGALFLIMSMVLVACGADPSSPSTASVSPAPTQTAPPPVATPSGETSSPSASGGVTGPTSSDEIAEIYDAIEKQVDAIRGLKPVAVTRKTIDADELKQMNQASFDKDNPPDYVAGNDRLLKALGLLTEDQSLRDLYLRLIDSQVLGFYRPDAKTLYVVARSGSITGTDKITFAHEYDHALQDANFPGFFDEMKSLLDQSDQALARAAIFEGDGTLLMTSWAMSNMTPEDMADYIAASADPTQAEIIAQTPPVLVESLMFPYTSGLAFLTPRQMSGGWAGVDAIYGAPPVSTEQVMHPEKYDAREAPIKVELPGDLAANLGSGWKELLQDTYGEFQMGSWLRGVGVPTATANAAAEGWGGDRLAVLSGPDGAWAMVMKTAWDSATDAEEFEAAAATAAAKAGGSAAVLPGEGGTTRWFVVGSDDSTLARVANILGLAG